MPTHPITTIVAAWLAWGIPSPAPPAAPELLPPDPYVVDGLGTDDMKNEWIAKRPIKLFALPGTRRQVAVVAAGDVMYAQALQLRGRPWEIRVLHDYPPLRAGMRLWILARDLEEGYCVLWYQGQTRDDLQTAIDYALEHQRCGRGSKNCWLHFAKEIPQQTWVQVTTNRGATGWMLRTDGAFEVGKPRQPGDGAKSAPPPNQ